MERLKALKWNYIIEALIMVAIGVILIVWPQASLEIMAKALAALLTLVGVVLVISYFAHRERTIYISGGLGLGLILAVIGVWIFVNPKPFIDMIPKLFGVFIIAGGIFHFAQAISLIRYKYSLWWLSMILAVLTIAAGCILLFKTDFAESLLVTLIGGSLIFEGVTNLWTISRVSKAARKVSNALNQAVKDLNAVDADAKVVDDSAER